jgi:uncharacterized protein (DUF111 family)
MAWTEAEQIKCFGITEAEVEKEILSYHSKVMMYDRTMYAMSVLSDVQHIIANNVYGEKTNEVARQWMNKAKYAIGEVHGYLRERGE